MNELHLKYLQETGNRPTEREIEIEVVRMRGLWVLDPDYINDDEVLRIWGRTGTLTLAYPDQDYIDWLEDQLQ